MQASTGVRESPRIPGGAPIRYFPRMDFKMKHLSRFAGVIALLGLAGVPVSGHADGRRSDERAGPAVRQVGDSAVLANQEAAAKMRGRMTPEERRRLREDVFDAGRSLYPPERPGGPGRHPAKGG